MGILCTDCESVNTIYFHAAVFISSSSETLEIDLDLKTEKNLKDLIKIQWGVFRKTRCLYHRDLYISCYRNSIISYREKIMQLVYINIYI